MKNNNNNILNKKEILKLVNNLKDHFTQTFKSKIYSNLYKSTANFIELSYTGSTFMEKVYKYIYGEKYCKQCNQILISKRFRSFFDGYCGEFCSKRCAYDHPQRIKNIKLTKKEKYGDENYNNQKKCRKTFLKKYGVNHNWAKNSPIREQCYITNEKLHGDRNWNNKEKYKKTCLEKYGVEHVAQDPVIHNKIFKHRWKKYKLPNGKIILVQGYEPFALNIILQKHTEDDIVTKRKDIPKFWYYKSNNKKCIYYPDIFIKSTNTIIEVKSTWTNKLFPEMINLKKEAVLKAGYNFEKMIFNNKGELVNE